MCVPFSCLSPVCADLADDPVANARLARGA
jgi:hypothetical protein